MEADHELVENISLTIEHKGVSDRCLQPIEVSQSAPALIYKFNNYCESTYDCKLMQTFYLSS